MVKNLDFLMDKLFQMNTFLGGDMVKRDYRSGKGNLLEILNNDFFKKYKEVLTAQDQRNAQRKKGITSIEILRWNNTVQNGFDYMESILTKMNEYFRKNKSRFKDEKGLEARQIIQTCQDLMAKMKRVEEVNNDYKEKMQNRERINVKFNAELIHFDVEKDLFGDKKKDDGKDKPKKGKREDDGIKQVDKNVIRKLEKVPLSQMEKQALERWKKKNGEINEKLTSIGNKLDELVEGLDTLDVEMERNARLIDYVGNEAFKLNEKAETTNAQMKIILDRFKRPGRFCIDICMSFILASLIGMFSYLLRKFLTS